MWDEFFDGPRFDMRTSPESETDFSESHAISQPSSSQSTMPHHHALADLVAEAQSRDDLRPNAAWLLDVTGRSETISYAGLADSPDQAAPRKTVDPSRPEPSVTLYSSDPSGDDDGDGVSNGDDPDWADVTVPGTRPKNVDEDPIWAAAVIRELAGV